MNVSNRNHRWNTQMGFALALFLLAPATADAQQARLQLDQLGRLAERAREVVDVTLDQSMLQMAAGVLSAASADEGAIKQLISGVEGIYVKSFEFNEDGSYSEADVDGVRKQLAAPGWSRLVAIRDGPGEAVEVYAWRSGGRIGGLAILVAERQELTVANIVGEIDLARLAALQGQFGIPRLPTGDRSPE